MSVGELVTQAGGALAVGASNRVYRTAGPPREYRGRPGDLTCTSLESGLSILKEVEPERLTFSS